MSSFGRAGSSNSVDRTSIADQIFRDLKEQIVLGEIARGAKLPTERELVERYKVSGPTVREAMRGLTALGLLDVRHGSGAYVTAEVGTLIATSLGPVIQLEDIGAVEVLNVLGMLNEQAAGLAAQVATKEDHVRLRAALVMLEASKSGKSAAVAVRNFHRVIASAARNPLLTALCGFLVDVQTELGVELAGDSIEEWRRMFSKLKAIRTNLINAIITGDREAAMKYSGEFHTKAVAQIISLPKAKEVRLTDPKLQGLLSSMMSRIGLT